jgi:hypothetical protein
MQRHFRRGGLVLGTAVLAALPGSAWSQQDYETPGHFKASALLKPDRLKGPHYTVAEDVPTPRFYHEFAIASDFGEMSAMGLSMLDVRIVEVAALAKLKEVSKSEVFVQAAGQSLAAVGKGVVNVAKDPEGTAKGIGGGIKRFGTNLGRKSKRAADSAVDAATTDEEEKKQQAEGQAAGQPQASTGEKAKDTGTAVADSALGVTGAQRRWAQKVGVDPYSTNPILRKTLHDIGQVDAAGHLATKIVVPVPAVVSVTAGVGDLVWGKDPEALLKHNEALLKQLGVDAKVAGEFGRSAHISLSGQTRLVAALSAVKAQGSADYVDTARLADSDREGLFHVESAEMMQALHGQAKVARILTDSIALVAGTADGRAVLLLPLDSVVWTKRYAEQLGEITDRARKELGARSLEIRLTGRMSDRALAGTKALGWSVSQGVPLPKGPGKPAAKG